MIEHPAAVIAVDRDNDSVWVSVHKNHSSGGSACGICSGHTYSEQLHSEQTQCGVALFAKLLAGANDTKLRITTSLPLHVGDQIRLGIQEKQLLTYSLLIYLMPLAGFLSAALVAHMINNNNDWLMSLTGLSGLFAGFIAVRWFNYKKTFLYPIILN